MTDRRIVKNLRVIVIVTLISEPKRFSDTKMKFCRSPSLGQSVGKVAKLATANCEQPCCGAELTAQRSVCGAEKAMPGRSCPL
jgi:hypothetical protein